MPPKKGKGKKKLTLALTAAQKAGIEKAKKTKQNIEKADAHYSKKLKQKALKALKKYAKQERVVDRGYDDYIGQNRGRNIRTEIDRTEKDPSFEGASGLHHMAALVVNQRARDQLDYNSEDWELGDGSWTADEINADNSSSRSGQPAGSTAFDPNKKPPSPPEDPDDPNGGGGGGDDRKDIKKKSDSNIYMSYLARNDLRLRNAMIRFYKSNTPGNIEKFRISNFDAYSDVAKRVLNNPENKIMLENLYRENRQTQAIVDPIGFVKARMKKENNKVSSLLNDMKSADVMKNLQGNTPLQTEEHVSRYFRRGIEDLVRDVDDEFPINAIRQAMTGSGATGAQGNVVKKSKTKKA